MAEIILRNNIRWDRELLKQVQQYKWDGTVPRLADRNFTEIALAVTIEQAERLLLAIKEQFMKSSLMTTLGGDWTP